MSPVLFNSAKTMVLTTSNNGKCKRKLSKCRILYYANTVATRQLLLLSGDVDTNPGWQVVIDRDGDYLQDFARTSNQGSNVSVAHINIRSLRNKVDEVKVLLHVCRFDILAITETHLDRKISNSQLKIDNYKIIRRDRDANTIGGGCLFYIASHICSTRLRSLESSDIEAIWLKGPQTDFSRVAKEVKCYFR